MTESDLIIENIINQIEGRPLNEMAQWRQAKDFLTGWITPGEANEFIRNAIASGEYAKGEIKKSSMRWADSSDHSKGYLCRVVLAGDKASPKREYSTRSSKRHKIVPKAEELNDGSKIGVKTIIDAVREVADTLSRALSSGRYIKEIHGKGYCPTYGKRKEWIANMVDGWCKEEIGVKCGFPARSDEAYDFGRDVINGSAKLPAKDREKLQEYCERLESLMYRYEDKFEYEGPTCDPYDEDWF